MEQDRSKSNIMTTKHTDAEVSVQQKITTEHIPGRLLAQLEQVDLHSSLTRLEFEIDKTDILNWLRAQSNGQKIFWSNRERSFEVAGLYSAHHISGDAGGQLQPAFAAMKESLHDDERLRFYGGLRFNSINNGDLSWQSFSYFHFHIPLFEMLRRDQRYFFACNIFLPENNSSKELLRGIRRKAGQLNFNYNGRVDKLPALVQRRDNPDESGWKQNVQRALQYLRENGLKKVVLARKSDMLFRQAPAAEALLHRLKDTNPNAFLFLFQSREGDIFLGNTPERLYRRDGRSLQTEAVAGTRRRGLTADEDRQLKEDLLNCEKDLREHDYVVRTIENVLRDYCRHIEKDEHVGILENARVQHLILRFKALLRDEISDAHILRTLHPTPAVGGYPTDPALYKINEIEQFDRGWYAGPVGWISKERAEFAVAIRSALISGAKVSLFSGAGIVEGSDPDAEWREIENKIANFIRIFHAG